MHLIDRAAARHGVEEAAQQRLATAEGLSRLHSVRDVLHDAEGADHRAVRVALHLERLVQVPHVPIRLDDAEVHVGRVRAGVQPAEHGLVRGVVLGMDEVEDAVERGLEALPVHTPDTVELVRPVEPLSRDVPLPAAHEADLLRAHEFVLRAQQRGLRLFPRGDVELHPDDAGRLSGEVLVHRPVQLDAGATRDRRSTRG